MKRNTELKWVNLFCRKVENFSNNFLQYASKKSSKIIVSYQETSWDIAIKVLNNSLNYFKGALSGLRQFLATESPLKMMKNAFYFTSKSFFVLKAFKFLSWHFSHVAKRLDQKDNFNFKFCDVTAWLTNNCNTLIAQYLKK